MKKIFCFLMFLCLLFLVGCKKNDNNEQEQTPPDNGNNEEVTYITVTEALEIAKAAGESGTPEKYYVKGTVKNITNATYGEMYITDGENELYVYGVYSSDGEFRYVELEEKPYSGDEVFLYGTLKTYKGSPELGASWLQKFISHQGEVDLTVYQEMTISDARLAEVDKKVIVSGVVGVITYANGKKPNGFYLIDDTGSIYIYGLEIASRVKVGENVKIAGTKTLYILDSEKGNASIYGYQGSVQLQDAVFISSDGGNHEFSKLGIKDSTVKEILETPLSNNITTSIFKVTAIIRKAPGSGFTNYYINDLDNETGSYCYSLCNGDDFSYLDEFDGKICTVYLSALNCKATKSGTVYRFVPVLVEENKNFTMTDEEITKFILDYYIKPQFKKEYNSDPELKLLTRVSNELIPFEDAFVDYSTSDDDVLSFSTGGGITLHIAEANKVATLHARAFYNDAMSECDIEIKVETKDIPETLSISDCIAAVDGTTVTVRGIVMSGTVNQTGFYLNDGTGVIAVRTNSETLKEIDLGNDIVVTGVKTHVIKEGSSVVGQICIDNATLVVNLLGNNEYDTSTFITDKTFEEIYSMAATNEDLTANVYVFTCYLKKVESQYSTNFYLTDETKTKDIYLYAGSGSQYSIYNGFVGDKLLTVTMMFVNWNSKTPYRGCLISASDGETTIINNYNFKK